MRKPTFKEEGFKPSKEDLSRYIAEFERIQSDEVIQLNYYKEAAIHAVSWVKYAAATAGRDFDRNSAIEDLRGIFYVTVAKCMHYYDPKEDRCASFRTYVHRALDNAANSWLRSGGHLGAAEWETYDEIYNEYTSLFVSRSKTDEIGDAIAIETVERVYSELPERKKTALNLVANGVSQEDVGKLVGRTQGWVSQTKTGFKKAVCSF